MSIDCEIIDREIENMSDLVIDGADMAEHRLPSLLDDVTRTLFHDAPQKPMELLSYTTPTAIERDHQNLTDALVVLGTENIFGLQPNPSPVSKQLFVRVDEVDEDWHGLQAFSDRPSVLRGIAINPVSAKNVMNSARSKTLAASHDSSCLEQTCSPSSEMREARVAFFEKQFGPGQQKQ
jgi:hypothetical protein